MLVVKDSMIGFGKCNCIKIFSRLRLDYGENFKRA